jgi:hypothetical protein
MTLVVLRTFVSKEEVINSSIEILPWVEKRLKSEMFHKWPVKNERVDLTEIFKLNGFEVSIIGQWKEPVQ